MKKSEVLKNIKNKDDKILCSNILNKYFEYIKRGITKYSGFIDKSGLNLIVPILNKIDKNYSIYYPNEYCENCIIVFGNIKDVNICCLEIIKKIN